MPTNDSSLIEKIEARIADIQKSHVAQQEQLKKLDNDFERHINDSALKIIDILDMIGLVQSNMDLSSQANSGIEFVIKKVEKRLIEMLRRWQVQEVVFKEGKIEPGKVRVLETRKVSSEISANSIIEVCRKGYQRNNKIIRPADVIASDSDVAL